MKAIYQKPTTEIMFVAMDQHLMQASKTGGLLGGGDNPQNLNLDNAGETSGTSNNLSRSFSIWGDDED